MTKDNRPPSNFAPNTCILKLRQYADLLRGQLRQQVRVHAAAEDSQFELLRRMHNLDLLPQAKRYSRSFNVFGGAEAPGGPWEKYCIPFAHLRAR